MRALGWLNGRITPLSTSEMLGISNFTSVFDRVASVSTWTLIGPCRELESALSFRTSLGEGQKYGQEMNTSILVVIL